jgi:hypothetical protein
MLPVFEYLVAAWLITAPTLPEGATAAVPDEMIPYLEHLCLEWEISDPRETQWFFSENIHHSFKMQHRSYLISVRRDRFVSLKDAPPLRDRHLFPLNHEYVKSIVNFNRLYYANTLERKANDFNGRRQVLYEQILEETNSAWNIWSQVLEITHEFTTVYERREALKNLHDAIGEKRYYACDLPPFVPMWSFVPVP